MCGSEEMSHTARSGWRMLNGIPKYSSLIRECVARAVHVARPVKFTGTIPSMPTFQIRSRECVARLVDHVFLKFVPQTFVVHLTHAGRRREPCGRRAVGLDRSIEVRRALLV